MSNNKVKNYVIIGNSAGAVGCVEGIRANDKDGKIIIISDEKHHTYSRPLISYLLLGKTTLELMKYRNNDFYKVNNCDLMLEEKVVKIDVKNKCVQLENGKQVNYDKLMVSTGSSPFVPPMDGLEKVECKHTFAKLDDALALEKDVNKNSKVLIIGAGLIGLKCAECLKDRAHSVTVVDLAPRVLSSILEDEGSDIMKKHLEDNGIKLFLGESVKHFDKNCAELTGGEKIDFDVLVLAVGVRPNTALVKDAGGDVTRGITINAECKTSLKSIYAAGDCTESVNAVDGQVKIMALLPNAYMQGECAGNNMAGNKKEFTKAIPENSIGLFGKHMITAGNYTGEVYSINENGTFKKLFYSDNKLNGFIIIGDVKRAGIYTSLVRERTPLDTIDFELVKENPCLMAFSRKYRNEKLGGVK